MSALRLSALFAVILTADLLAGGALNPVLEFYGAALIRTPPPVSTAEAGPPRGQLRIEIYDPQLEPPLDLPGADAEEEAAAADGAARTGSAKRLSGGAGALKVSTADPGRKAVDASADAETARIADLAETVRI